jgi:hypothetical protein
MNSRIEIKIFSESPDSIHSHTFISLPNTAIVSLTCYRTWLNFPPISISSALTQIHEADGAPLWLSSLEFGNGSIGAFLFQMQCFGLQSLLHMIVHLLQHVNLFLHDDHFQML